MSPRRKADTLNTPIHCSRCGLEIVFCDGAESWWMHEATRREHCANGRLAEPLETVE